MILLESKKEKRERERSFSRQININKFISLLYNIYIYFSIKKYFLFSFKTQINFYQNIIQKLQQTITRNFSLSLLLFPYFLNNKNIHTYLYVYIYMHKNIKYFKKKSLKIRHRIIIITLKGKVTFVLKSSLYILRAKKRKINNNRIYKKNSQLFPFSCFIQSHKRKLY